MIIVNFYYWGTNQAIIQRALGARNLKEGQKGLLLAAFIKILGPIIVVLPGIIAFYIFKGDIPNADEAIPDVGQGRLACRVHRIFCCSIVRCHSKFVQQCAEQFCHAFWFGFLQGIYQ